MAKHVKGSAIANASSYKLYLANGTELATQSTNVSAGIDFDLSTIAALTAAGTYSLGVKAISGDTTKFLDSAMSNLVSYTVAPTNYTFTINPNPTSATVTLSATGYSTVSGTGSKSITVANGTTVNWRVEASGYTTRTGDWTISGGNKTENIVLVTSATPVNLWKYSSSDMDSIMANARYRLTTGLPYKEEGDEFDKTYGTTEKIYINGNSGTYNLNLQSGKTYRWQFIPYFEYGFLKLHNPWGGPEQNSMAGKRVFFYKADDTLIENDKKCLDATGMLVTVPADAVYMRFMAWGYAANKSKVKPRYNTLMITEGETEYSEYVPYQG